jgi:hypothetical protein
MRKQIGVQVSWIRSLLSARNLFALLTGASLGVPSVTWPSVYNIAVPGQWPEGRITWYYNPAGRPADIGDAEIIDTVKQAFAEWNRVCQVEGTFGGVTNTPVNPVPTGAFVVGWTDFGSPQFHAKGAHRSMSGSTAYAPFTGGATQINVANPNWRKLLDNGTALGIIQHEIGHSLGLAHSDDPTSIMFANPYNTSRYEMRLQGDDIAACADLYGGRGLIDQPDLRNSTPLRADLAVRTSVLSAKPGSATPPPGLGRIDPAGGGPYYFDTRWSRLPLGTSIRAEWVAPNGSVFFRANHAATVNSGYWYSTFPDSGMFFPYSGRWAFQVSVDGELAASTSFEVSRGSVAPVVPFEAAVLGETDGAGAMAWRVVPMSGSQPTKLRVVANGVAATAMTTGLRSGGNAIDVWMETDRPRYKIGQTDGQPAHSYDVMRRARFFAGAGGRPLKSSPDIAESGVPSAYSATATLTLAAEGEVGIFVAASVAGRLYFRLPSGWSERAGALVTARGPGVAVVDVVRQLDTRGLPAGTRLFVGYGRTLDEVIASGQYALVRAF